MPSNVQKCPVMSSEKKMSSKKKRQATLLDITVIPDGIRGTVC